MSTLTVTPANETSPTNDERIFIELRLGHKGLQAGCHAIIVRAGGTAVQTPWLLGQGTVATDTARAVEKRLRKQAPDALFTKIGYV